jgi:2-polyprenyl-3-methyl-5-hydroxy-6-metoxy-1,4-benzoquinol methylase
MIMKFSEIKIILRERLFLLSLKAAAREQGLQVLAQQLRKIVPDLEDQYSQFAVKGDYLETNVRLLHAFQVSLIKEVIKDFTDPVIVDIGDSAGTHLRYMQALFSSDRKIRALSVNLDPKAVERIKAKGLKAICARAEDLCAYQVNADIFLCFEVMEHLFNPCQFLHDLAQKTNVKYFIATVPFVRKSRLGLRHIRKQQPIPVFAESTHIFELSVDDWRLLVQHAGWRMLKEKIYFQYPRKSVLRFLKPFWAKCDFEGYYGMILTRDSTWSSLYKDW